MKRKAFLIFCGLFVLACPVGSSQSWAQGVSAVVTGVEKGDSLKVLLEGKALDLHLCGIRCPELNEPYGQEARLLTSQLVLNREIRVETTARPTEAQMIGNVRLEDGSLLSHRLVQKGLAYWDPSTAENDVKLQSLEQFAKDLGTGVWSSEPSGTTSRPSGGIVTEKKDRISSTRGLDSSRTMTFAGVSLLVLAALGLVGLWMLRRKPKEPRIRSKMQGQEKPVKARMIGESTEAIESSKRFVEELLLSLSDFVKEMVKSNTSYNTKMNDHKVSLKRAMTLAGLEQVQRLLIQEIEGIQASSEHYRTKLEKANTTIKEQQEVMRKFEADATVDFLTQLANRRAFDSRLAEEYERMRRYGGTFSLILVDIDEFKKVNDEFGHLAGDLILQFIARMLQDNVRISDCVGRYGGEEFAILLPGTSSEGARVAAEKIRHAVQTSAVKHENQNIKVTISAGAGMIRPKGEKPDGLIARVDAALYCAKRNGRNRVEMAEEDQMLPQEKTAPRVGP